MRGLRTLLTATLVAALIGAPVAQGSGSEVSDPEVVAPTVEQPTVDLADPNASTTFTSTKPFAMVAATWDPGESASTIQVRTRSGDQWSEWVSLEVAEVAVDPGSVEATSSRPATEPLWVGAADAVQVRTAGVPASSPRLELIDPGVAPQDDDVTTRTTAGAASATPSMPRIVTRQAWGADESLRRCTPAIASTLKAAVVHHTVGTNTYAPEDSAAIVRGIYAFHTQSRGWCDIGYNYLVDKYGTVFEGRYGGVDQNVVGAHVGGFNTSTLGVSMMGDHSTVSPTAATIDAMSRLLGWRLGSNVIDPLSTTQLVSAGNSKYPSGTTVTIPRVVGHRDLYATECPGNTGYLLLPSIRARVDDLVALPVTEPFVRTNYSLEIYARTPAGAYRHLSYPDWVAAGSPTPTVVPAIPGTTYQRTSWSPEYYAVHPSGRAYWLTYPDWVAAGSPTPTVVPAIGSVR
jgi:uncharacterized protein with LGFP repeats